MVDDDLDLETEQHHALGVADRKLDDAGQDRDRWPTRALHDERFTVAHLHRDRSGRRRHRVALAVDVTGEQCVDLGFRAPRPPAEGAPTHCVILSTLHAHNASRTVVDMSTTTTTQHEGRLLDIEHGRGYLGGISREKLYQLIRAGELSVVKIGRRTFIDRAELDRFIDERMSA